MTEKESVQHQDTFMELFPQRLKQARKANNFTQEDLADLSGVSKGSVSAYEKGSKIPSAVSLVGIASALRVSIGWLCGENSFENKDGDIDTGVFLNYIEEFLSNNELLVEQDYKVEGQYSISITGNSSLFSYIDLLNKYKLSNDRSLDEMERKILFMHYYNKYKTMSIKELLDKKH